MNIGHGLDQCRFCFYMNHVFFQHQLVGTFVTYACPEISSVALLGVPDGCGLVTWMLLEKHFSPLHASRWILHLWSRCWRIYLPLWLGGLMPAILGLFLACPSSNHADGGHVEPWLGSKPLDPYRFNNYKQQLVAQETVLGPVDIFLIIQVDFDLRRKLNITFPQQDSAKVLGRLMNACAKATILMSLFWNWIHPSSLTKHSRSCRGSVKLLL